MPVTYGQGSISGRVALCLQHVRVEHLSLDELYELNCAEHPTDPQRPHPLVSAAGQVMAARLGCAAALSKLRMQVRWAIAEN
jgi:hypothetical protein